MKVTGTVKPLGAKVFVSDMEFGEQKSAGGIYIPSDDGKSEGVKPRWCRVWAIGSQQKDFNVGDWIYVEHGRWTRGIEVEEDDGTPITVRRVDLNAVMLSSDEKPTDIELGQHTTPEHGSTHRAEDFVRY